MISAILLAAGESRRMETFKQLLDYDGKTFVECCVDNLLASRADEVVIVTGHRDADVRRALAGRAVTFVFNADYRAGMSSSIKRGVSALTEKTEAILLSLADQPQIGAPIIDHVIDVYHSRRPLLVVPTYAGRNGHPIVLSARLKPEILGFDDAIGLRQVVHANSGQAIYTEVGSEAVLLDFDYPEDYERLGRKR